MFIAKQKIAISTLLLMCAVAFTSVSAATPKKRSGKKKTKARTSVSHKVKSTKVVQSAENISGVVSVNNKATTLPVFDKVLDDRSSDAPGTNVLLADASVDAAVSMEIVRRRMLEQKEMKELSSALGVTINNTEHIDLYREVASWLGTRYLRGGMNRKAVDCSGFTNLVYKTVFDQQLDRVSTTIAKNVKESITNKADLQPGDMVFFSTFKKKYINHVGVYIGDGKFIHASIKKGVIVSSLAEGYYSTAWRKGGRN